MWAFRVVVGQPFSDPSPHFRTCLKSIQINAFILQRPPEPFDHAVVAPRAFTVHADLDLCISEHVDPSITGKLAALVRIKYLWLAVLCQRLFQGFNAGVSRVQPTTQRRCRDIDTALTA